MNYVLLVLLVFLLAGCSGKVNPEVAESGFQSGFGIDILNATHEDAFISDNDTISERVSFLIRNKEDFSVDCVVDLEISNQTNSSTKRGKVGILEPDGIKNVSLTFEMFEGDASFSVIPLCKRP